MTAIRIALAEDQGIIREGLVRLLSDNSEFQVVASSGNGKELINSIQGKGVDLVLLDEEMAEMNGHQTLSFLKEFHPEIKVIFFTLEESLQNLRSLIINGAKTVLNKSVGFEVLVEAIRQVYLNEFFYYGLLTPELLYGIDEEVKHEGAVENRVVLTAREAEIIVLICKGRSNGEISLELCLSQRTVENHRMRISKKTECRTTAELVVYAIRNGVYEI